MNVDIPAIFARSAGMVLRDRVFWVLGFLLLLTSSTITFTYNQGGGLDFFLTGRIPEVDENTTRVTQVLGALGCLTSVVYILLFILVRPRVQAGLIAGVAQADGGEAPELRAAWQNGLRSMWTVLGLDLVLFALIFVFSAVITVIILAALVSGIFTAISTTIEDPFTPSTTPDLFQVLGPALGWVCGLILIALPFVIVLSTIVEFGKRAAVLDGQTFGPAWGTGWRLLRSNFGKVLLFTLLELLAGLALAIPLLLLSFLLTAALATLVSLAAGETGLTVLLALLAGLIGWAVSSAIGALPLAWHTALWTLLYRALSPAPAGTFPGGGWQQPGYNAYGAYGPPTPYAQPPPSGYGTPGAYAGYSQPAGPGTTPLHPAGQEQSAPPPHPDPAAARYPTPEGGYTVPGQYPGAYNAPNQPPTPPAPPAEGARPDDRNPEDPPGPRTA